MVGVRPTEENEGATEGAEKGGGVAGTPEKVWDGAVSWPRRQRGVKNPFSPFLFSFSFFDKKKLVFLKVWFFFPLIFVI